LQNKTSLILSLTLRLEVIYPALFLGGTVSPLLLIFIGVAFALSNLMTEKNYLLHQEKWGFLIKGAALNAILFSLGLFLNVILVHWPNVLAAVSDPVRMVGLMKITVGVFALLCFGRIIASALQTKSNADGKS